MTRLACWGTVLCIAMMAGCSPEIIMETDTSSSSTSVGGATGGTGSTGSTSSGSGGAGGTAGSGGTMVSPPPECTFDSDCTLVNDCCTCQGIPAGMPFPECPAMECFAPSCEAIAVANPAAICRAGQCVVDADCNHSHIMCKSLPPVCPPGKTPHVVNGCWGGCIDVTECREIGDCIQCNDGQACVTSNTMMAPAQHCVEVPDSCLGQINCDCMGEMVCGFGMSCFEASATALQCIDITTK